MFPSNLTDEATSTTSFPIKNCLGLLVCLFLWITIDLNLSGLTIILFSENHLIAFDSAISVSSSNVTDFANDDNILSSAKLYTDAFWMQKKKSFKNALNNIGPTIEPCDTPEIMSLKSLQTLLTQTVFQTRPSGTGFTLRLHVEIKFCPSRAGQFSIRLGWNSVAFCLGSRQCYKLFINYILQLQAKSFILTMQNPSFVLPGFHFAGTKLSHVITSARLNEMKKLINKSAWKKSMEVHFNRSNILQLHFYDAYELNLWEKRVYLYNISSVYESMGFRKLTCLQRKIKSKCIQI